MARAARVLPDSLIPWVLHRDTGEDMRWRLVELVLLMRRHLGQTEWTLCAEEFAAVAWQLGGFILPPGDEMQDLMAERGWLFRPYDDGLPEPAQETETMP